MIHGTGVDIIEIERIRDAMERHVRFVERVFTPGEAAYCYSKGRPEASFAGRFAAKEAIAKALGISLYWHEVEILCNHDGKPIPVLHGRAATLAEMGTVHVSISHTHRYAVAQAIIEYHPAEEDRLVTGESW